MKHTVYMECGSIISGVSGCIIEEPAIMFDKETSTLYAWGNVDAVRKKYNRFLSAGMHDNMVMLELSNYRLTHEMQCFILRFASEHSGTSFLRDLYAKRNDPKVLEWLTDKMKRMGVELEVLENQEF